MRSKFLEEIIDETPFCVDYKVMKWADNLKQQGKMKEIIENKLKDLTSEMEAFRIDEGVSFYRIEKDGLINRVTASNIANNENCKLFSVLAFLSSLGKTIEIVDMPEEMKKACDEWNKI